MDFARNHGPARCVRGLDANLRSIRGRGRALGRLGIGVVALSVASCSIFQPKPEEVPEQRGNLARLAELQPGDIVIAPVRNQTGNPDVPLAAMREGVAVGLVERMYSPLSNAYVDANWGEAAFQGTPAPDGMLVVALSTWDPSRLYSTGAVRAAGELLLFEGGTTAGTPLWGGTFEATVDLGDGRGNPPTPSQELFVKAARMLGAEAVRALPERDPVAAHAGGTVQN